MTVRVVLELDRSGDGVLIGSIDSGAASGPFHGLMELVAALERTVDDDRPGLTDRGAPR